MIQDEDEPYTGEDRPKPRPEASYRGLLPAAALAAGMLDEAWTAPGTSPLRAQVVRNLARGLKGELEALGGIEGETAADLLADGALRAADVANLAASSLEDLPEGSVADAVAATHLAAGASRALSALAEAVAVANPGGDHTEYALKDIRSARWRARFAVRQTEEFEEAREQK